MVERDRTHAAILTQIVLVRDVVPMPRHDVERGVTDSCAEEASREFINHRVLSFDVFELRRRVQEVARVCKTVCSDRTKPGELEVALVEF